MNLKGLGIDNDKLETLDATETSEWLSPESNLAFDGYLMDEQESRALLDVRATLPKINTEPLSPGTVHADVLQASPSLSLNGAHLFPGRRSVSPEVRSVSKTGPTDGSRRGLHETKKLLSHLLDRLEGRPAAPDIFAKYNHDPTTKTQKKRFGLDNLKANHSKVVVTGIGYEDFDDSGDWDTEPTVALLGQLLGLLGLARKQSLDLFRANEDDLRPPRSPTSPLTTFSSPNPKRKGRLSSVTTGGISPSTDVPAGISIPGPSLLQRLIDALTSLISTDCLYKVRRPRPTLPPNSLQASCLDLATCLMVAVGNDTAKKSEITKAVVSGFHSFPGEMAERLCIWFEGVISGVLEDLDHLRGGNKQQRQHPWLDPFVAPSASIPTMAFSTDPADISPTREQAGWMQWSPVASRGSNVAEKLGTISTHSPGLNPSIYHLASTIPPLIQAVASTINLSLAPLTTIHRVHRLLATIIKAKPDASLDLLEVAAYGTQDARYSSLAMLATFWPKSMGHVAIAKPLPLTTYEVDLNRWEIGREISPSHADTGHEYVPWRTQSTPCSHCDQQIVGFAVTCLLCHDMLHLDCYDPIDQVIPLPPTLGQASATPSAIKFSFVLRPSKATSDYADEHMLQPTRQVVGQHHLALVNLFTLTLCAKCRLPMWGITAQSYACTAGCGKLFHDSCLHTLGHSIPCHSSRATVTIRSEAFRQSFEKEFEHLLVDAQQIEATSPDELAILHGVMWIQLELLENGLAHSGLIIQSKLGDRVGSDDLELPQLVRRYADALKLGRPKSEALTDYVAACKTDTVGTSLENYLFSWPFLSYLTALLRSPMQYYGDQPDSGLLHVAQEGLLDEMLGNEQATYQTLTVGTMRQVLRNEFGIASSAVMAFLLAHLHHLGFFHRRDLEVLLRPESQDDTPCVFALPSTLDASIDVEILIAVIEVSLDQIDLAVNEHAFLLLLRRAWPSPLCSESVLERLAEAVLRWILDESTHLLAVIANFASKNRPLPGVRVPRKGSGSAPTTSASHYKADRQKLLDIYARRWLQALHDLQPDGYAATIYEIAKHQAQASPTDGEMPNITDAFTLADNTLHSITKLQESLVTFSGSHDLLLVWLEDLGDLSNKNLVFKSLARLFNVSRGDPTLTQETFWEYTRVMSGAGQETLGKTLRWVRVLAQSGVHLPLPVLKHLQGNLLVGNVEQDHLLDFMIALSSGQLGWNQEDVLDLACPVVRLWFEKDTSTVAASFDDQLELLKQCLQVLLTAYGVSEDAFPPELRTPYGSSSLASKVRHNTDTQRLAIDLELLDALVHMLDKDSVSGRLVAVFLCKLLSKSSRSSNTTAAIHRLNDTASALLWGVLKDTHSAEIRHVYVDLLLVFIPMDSTAIERAIAVDDASDVGPALWQLYLDLMEQDVRRGSRHWKSSVADIIIMLLGYLATPKVSIESETLRRSILPTQLEFMSSCFEDRLIRSDMDARLRLLNKLDQQRGFFRLTPIIGWATVEALVAEQALLYNELISDPSRKDELVQSSLLRASLLAMALDSISLGAKIPPQTHHRLMTQSERACLGLADSDYRDSLTLISPALCVVMDSPLRVESLQSTSGGATAESSLVGAPLVNPLLRLISELDFVCLSYTLQRNLLDILTAIFYKHTISEVMEYAPKALETIVDVSQLDISAESRLMALSVLQTAVARCHHEVISRALPHIVHTLSAIILTKDGPLFDAAVVHTARNCMYTLQSTFAGGGLLLMMVKDHVKDEELMESCGVADVLRGVYQSPGLISGTKSDQELCAMVFQDVIDGLLTATRKTSDVSLVFRSLRHFAVTMHDFSSDTIIAFGLFLTKFTRHVAEWTSSELDPNPVLDVCQVLLQCITGESTTIFLHQTATFLMLALARFDVNAEALERIVTTSSKVCQEAAIDNTIVMVVYEQLGTAIQGATVTDMTLFALLSILVLGATSGLDTSAQPHHSSSELLLGSSPGCLALLQRSAPGSKNPDLAIRICLLAARVLLLADDRDQNALALLTEAISSQAAATQLRTFSFLLLDALHTYPADGTATRLLSLLPILGRLTGLAFKACSDFLTIADKFHEGAELLTRAFVVVRAVFLLVSRAPKVLVTTATTNGDAFWQRIWPDLERLLFVSLQDQCQASALKATLHTTFLDLIPFLSASNAALLILHANRLRTILVVLMAENAHGVTKQSTKYDRAFEALSVPDQLAHTYKKALMEIENDLAATERLLALRRLAD